MTAPTRRDRIVGALAVLAFLVVMAVVGALEKGIPT